MVGFAFGITVRDGRLRHGAGGRRTSASGGRSEMDQDDEVVVLHGPRAVWAAALSVLWPGLGHVYVGATSVGAALVTAQVVLVIVTVFPHAWRVTGPLWAVLVVAAALSAAWSARRSAPPETTADAASTA